MVENGDMDKNGKRAPGARKDRAGIPDTARASDWSAPAFVWPETGAPATDAGPADTVPDKAPERPPHLGAVAGPVPQTGPDDSLWYDAGDPALRLLRDYNVPANRDALLAGAIITLSGVCDQGLEVLRYDLSDTKILASLADLPMVGFAVLNFHGEDTAHSYRKVLNTVRYLNRKANATGGNRSTTFEVVDADHRLIDLRTVAVHVEGSGGKPAPPPIEPAEVIAATPAAAPPAPTIEPAEVATAAPTVPTPAPTIEPAEAAIMASAAPAPEPAAPLAPAIGPAEVVADTPAAPATPAPARHLGVFAAVAGYRIFEPRGAILSGPAGRWGAEYLFKKNMLWIKGRGAYVLFTGHVPQGRLIGPPMVRPRFGHPAVSGEMLVVLPVGAEVTIGRTRARRNGPPAGTRIH